ncbi:MAG: endonuclease/exonuclease/phosphatase family protein [Clostridia bacterium]|nr:endonuclease/exonuclease/phosphatase family protein [Clostridia bacterium]
MKTMSYNILCFGKEGHEREKREPLVLEIINKNNPDTLGVQEATPEWMSYLKNHLADYDYVGVGRDDGDNKGEYSAVFYKKDKYITVDKGNFWLSETPEKPGKGWDAVCVRICSWVLLEDKETGKRFIHLNTHLDHIGVQARKEGMKLIFDKAESFSVPTIVTGDFNFDQGSEFYEGLVSGKLRDSKFAAEISDDGVTYNAFGEYEGAIIDFIMVSPEIDVKKYTVVNELIDNVYPSDHFPVTAEIEF